jgi:uncharacterized protein GlcG (DUF336 family)
MSVTLGQAEKLSAAAKEKAKSIGVPVNIAIVAEGINLVSFHRWTMPGWVRSTSLSKSEDRLVV